MIITDKVIKDATKMVSQDPQKIAQELSVVEPRLYDWLRNSVRTSLGKMEQDAKISIPRDEEVMRSVCACILTMKVEAYLIGALGRNQAWDNRFGIESDHESPSDSSVEAFLAGWMPSEFYKNKYLDKFRSAEEGKDQSHWTNVAKKNHEMRSQSSRNVKIREHIETVKKDSGIRKVKKSDRDTGEVKVNV